MCQIEVDREIILQGGQQVSGLADPMNDDEAVVASGIQNSEYLYAIGSGINSITGSLSTPLTGYQTGMSVYLAITSDNTDSVTVSLNSLPAVPVRKNGSEALEVGDLLNGMVVQLVFDGSAFQVLTAPERPRRPCPSGMVQINSQFCIEPDERAALDFPDAANVCGQLGRRICTWGELSAACHRDSIYGLNDMVGNYEWTNTGANGDDLVRVAGWNNCRSAGTTFSISATPRVFRCCKSR